jgi:hypothetical protein
MLFHLADCLESAGRTTTAWRTFLEVASILHDAKQDVREKVVLKMASAIEPRLSRLTIQVPGESRVKGLMIQCDGHEIAEAQWGSPLPLDPGKHILEASAPGLHALTREVVLGGFGAVVVVVVPVLAPEGVTPSLPTAPASRDAGTSIPAPVRGR